MAWSGSNILYIIDEEMLCPEGKLGDRRATGPDSLCRSGLSDFSCEDQTKLTLLEYARGFQRRSTKKTC
jgi:hypothetical protein